MCHRMQRIPHVGRSWEAGLSPRLSKVNLFTLLSLWMELFPNNKKKVIQQRRNGLVVVHSSKIIGLHCSSMDLHVGQIAVLKHGSRLKECDLYFSRKPCSTCLKMVLNGGVNRISYWPGDPEMSLAEDKFMNICLSDAKLDAKAVERLKSNSRARVCILLQPLAYNMLQFVEETSKKCEFFQILNTKDSSFKHKDNFTECQRNRLQEFEKIFLITDSNTHKEILKTIGLENVCDDVHFTNLRHKMEELVFLLATIDCSIPMSGMFNCDDLDGASEEHINIEFQNFARHCMVQARLLAYRTEDQKIGVGAVIWAEGKSNNCDGTGARYLIGCGYNAYPTGSEYADFPQVDEKQQKDREARKFRYIIHAEQNALTFRCQDIKEDEKTMIFVTKCPCDECIPLINSAGIKQIYTGDLDAGKVKADISYQKFSGLQGVKKFTWQKILPSSVQAVHRKQGPNKPIILESSIAPRIVGTGIMSSSSEPEIYYESSIQEQSPSAEHPQSPLARSDLKRPLMAPWSEPQMDELLSLDFSEPAFKRRLVEHQCYLQNLMTSLGTVMNDVVGGVEKIVSSLNTSMADVHSVLDHHLTALQSSRESVSSQTVSVETYFTQGLGYIGAALQTALNSSISDMGSKVQESLQMGFESLGEKVQLAIRKGFADLVKEYASVHQNLMNRQGMVISSTSGLNSSSQEVGIHNSGLSLSASQPSELSSSSLLESMGPSVETHVPGGTNPGGSQ
ncbi:cytidine and dCMP deaminase domain-containing protein 1 isoform X2 [Narcine bancroftii]|uniref:cytidine and dCMP deaminase domain-containing protein 1 isoform X2 n=1 Tax=Narcine bancroftii TaxID=1343680 RepID=UPI0038311280